MKCVYMVQLYNNRGNSHYNNTDVDVKMYKVCSTVKIIPLMSS